MGLIHLANLLLVCLLLTNLTGLALLARKFTGCWALARAASPVLAVVPFFVEHFVGFGALPWVWPFTTAVSAWLIERDWRTLRENWRTEAVFLGGFAYALAWRYSFPDIDASSEKITDVTFVANYLHGDRLPPVDRWLPPSPFDMYYALQHYSAALLGRIFAAPAGIAYNLAFCVIVACVTTAAAATAWLLVRRRLPALLLMCALLFGGTGVSPFIRLVLPSPPLHASIRFMGSALSAKDATLPFGRWLVQAGHVSDASLDLPVELFSYLVGLGDFHPPLGGYLLLMLALLSIALIESEQAPGPAYAVLAATLPLTVAANAWDLPLQGVLVGTYVFYRMAARKRVLWAPLLGGGGAAALLIQPFLAHFSIPSVDYHAAIRLVPWAAHTPPLLGLLVFYPVLAVLGLHLLFGERTRPSLYFCALWLALLMASEFFFVDDLYGGKFERFNTVLKWWSWIYSGALLTVGAMNLRARSAICRWGTAAVLLLICSYSVELGAHFAGSGKGHLGQLDGAAWIRDDAADRAIMAFLASVPQATVLQRVPNRAYVGEPALIINAGQTAFLGWANHEDIWRGYRVDIDRRLGDVNRFYLGDLPDSADWLEQNNIQYVLWLKDDAQLPPHSYDKIQAQISGRYFWREYYAVGDFRVGIWTRMPGDARRPR